ncbi:hypothetical protein PMSD_03770 [Paenibacillus macquariensis subsp. defensor]|nr:hypothetical protein PMSD_03770 [Paenibacillus macquariensis subsp. defensor]
MSYVAIPNRMFARETEYFTANDEFLVFYHIGTLVSARNPNLAHLNIELLNSILLLDQKNPSRGKKRINVALLSLHYKGYIKIVHSDAELKNNTMLGITFPDTQQSIYIDPVKSGGSNYNGYTAVDDDMFSRTESVYELKVLTYVKWRSRIDYSISYREWESVLDVCHQTAVKIISDCVQKGLLTKLRGDYYKTHGGEIRQETNTYYEKSIEQESNLSKEANTAKLSKKLSAESKETRPHNLFGTEWLDVNDIHVYLTTTCELVKEQGRKRIDAISKIASGKARMDHLMKMAFVIIEKEKSEKQDMKVRSALSDASREMHGIGYEDRVEHEKHFRQIKQSSNNTDYTYLLGDD